MDRNLLSFQFQNQNMIRSHIPQLKISINTNQSITNGYKYLNDIFDIENFLLRKNEALKIGDFYRGYVKLNGYFKAELYKHGFLGKFIYIFSFFLHRVLPKLTKQTRCLYFSIFKGKNQRLSKAEVIGLLIRNGFKVEELIEQDGVLNFFVSKREEVKNFEKISLGPIFKMKRTGINGIPIVVYKLRTMHPYSEYVQDYMKDVNGLDSSGKFHNDFRITSWGRILRKYWIDEIPMIVNLIRGDIKLIGVRPISFSYLKLYPLDFQVKRRCFKPGLIPPFYADLPKEFNQIIFSEMRYLEQYEKRPVLTDFIYISKILNNIILKRSRSK